MFLPLQSQTKRDNKNKREALKKSEPSQGLALLNLTFPTSGDSPKKRNRQTMSLFFRNQIQKNKIVVRI